MQTQPALTAPSAGKPAAAEPQLQAMVAAHIDSVVMRSRGRYSRKGVVERLLSGDWQLWLVWDGSVKGTLATELYFDVSGDKACTIRFCTGADAKDWVRLIDHIESWARAEGCKRMAMQARKGWAKHLTDYKLTHVVLEKPL